ncbi:hypothetical protein Poly24_32910 [Rosistilla carotiformis]|uniref:Neutral/alkaline non-lysosomal ceramidase n=1 Tax=Rosistilla carotiformis TaxID=2528017 RepID=A0A518JVL2_9BACT|nr:hypothetical protein [Rosistilla carotiformis]QDV69575.1 hypothetical protein Poly24_32910 [Rosistilla carotiformis]
MLLLLSHRHRPLAMIATIASILIATPSPSLAAELHIGGATVSITPKQPVALTGQMRTRISANVESEVTATALALESRDGDNVVDQAIMVSCDLIAIREGVLDAVRKRVQDRIPGFDPKKLVMNATHTHTAPVIREGIYEVPDKGIMRPAEYLEFLADRVADAAVAAWESRQPGQVGWGLGHAVVAQNRRTVYSNGTAAMYGSTAKDNFLEIEGYEDHGVEVLFFWDAKDQLIATCVNVACPAQEVEGRSAVNADFWHPVRQTLREKYGEDLHVLAWTGAAGDQSPHLMYSKPSEERMRKLRGLTRLEELARRLVVAWEEALQGASQERHTDVPFVHTVKTIELPERMVTREESFAIKAKVAELATDPKQKRRMQWHQAAVDRFDRQQAGELQPYEMELHAIRLGDIAIATNDFELFTDFGIQMKARSPALQTFVIQLAGPGTYVPSARAARGGGYSAIVESNLVGPEGGQVLADQTVQQLKTLWADK